MSELALDGSNPDVGLLYRINDLSRDAPGWVNASVRFLGQYGLMAALAALLVWSWWRVARRQADDTPSAVAGVMWAGVGGMIALALSVPIRGVVQRPRPFEDQEKLHVLLRGASRYSFVSGHSTLAMAVGVGLLMVHRRAGLAGIAIALVEGFSRVYMGSNYPTDVIGGFALGTATALLLAPLAMLALVPLARVLDRGRGRVLVRAAEPLARPVPVPADPYGADADPDTAPGGEYPVEHPACDKDLAA